MIEHGTDGAIGCSRTWLTHRWWRGERDHQKSCEHSLSRSNHFADPHHCADAESELPLDPTGAGESGASFEGSASITLGSPLR